MSIKVFFKDFWCSQNVNHPKNNSPKFGYILDMKVRKEIESFSILGYMLELITKILWFGNFSLKFDKF
jgi:hypothetical protein